MMITCVAEDDQCAIPRQLNLDIWRTSYLFFVGRRVYTNLLRGTVTTVTEGSIIGQCVLHKLIMYRVWCMCLALFASIVSRFPLRNT